MSPPEKLRSRAIALLARRELSRAELADKLRAHETDAQALETLLDQLVEQGLVSNARCAEAFVNSRKEKLGKRRIVRELCERGIDAHTIAHAVEGLDELAAARSAWRKRFNRTPTDAREKARQIHFLQRRGFGIEIALKVVEAGVDG